MHIRTQDNNSFVNLKTEDDYLKFYESYVNQDGLSISFKPSLVLKSKNLTQVNYLMVDLDYDDVTVQFDKLIKNPLLEVRPTALVFTGSRGYHAYYKLDRYINVEEAVELQRGILVKLFGDPSLVDLTKSMRTPGFKSPKTGNYSRLEYYDANNLHSPDLFYKFKVSELGWRCYIQKHQILVKFSSILQKFISNILSLTPSKNTYERLKNTWVELNKGEFNSAYKWLNANTNQLKDLVKQTRANINSQLLSQKFTKPPEGYESHNILHYLAERYAEDYKYNGRNKAATCKCPLHGSDGGSSDSLHIFHDTYGLKCHAGCPSDQIIKLLHDRALLNNDPYANTRWTKSNLQNYTPNTIIHKKYFELDSSILNDEKFILGIKSAKGTGKTEWLSKNLKSRTLGLTHRKKLNHTLSARFGVPHIDKLSGTSLPDSVIMCINSLHSYGKGKFNLEHWSDKVVLVIDEVTQVIDALLSSPLMLDLRPIILKNLTEVLNVVDGLVILDADLDDATVDLFKNLIKSDVKIVKVYNTYKPLKENNVKLKLFTGSDPTSLIKCVKEDLNKGLKVALYTTSAKLTSKYSTKTLGSYFTNLGYKTAILDADTVEDPNHPCYNLINLESLSEYDIIIYSPVISTGVSILTSVDRVYGINYGNQNTTDFSQGLLRFRALVERRVWITSNPLQKSLIEGTTQSNVLINLQKQGEILNSVLPIVGGTLVSDFINHWCLIKSKQNRELSSYLLSQVEVFQQEGYDITNNGDSVNAVVKEDIKNVKNNNCIEYSNKIYNLGSLTMEEYENYKSNKSLYPELVKKGELLELYGYNNLSPSLILKDMDLDYRKLLKRHFNLIKYLNNSLNLEQFNITVEGDYYLPDLFNSELIYLKALADSNIMQFISSDVLLNNNLLNRWREKISQLNTQTLKLLGINVKSLTNKKGNIKLLNTVLANLGLRYKYVKRKNGVNYYGLDFEIDRNKIFKYWIDRESWDSEVFTPNRLCGSNEELKSVDLETSKLVYNHLLNKLGDLHRVLIEPFNTIKELGLKLKLIDFVEILKTLPSVGMVKNNWYIYNY